MVLTQTLRFSLAVAVLVSRGATGGMGRACADQAPSFLKSANAIVCKLITKNEIEKRGDVGSWFAY